MKVLDPLKGLGLVQAQAYKKVVMVENIDDKASLLALVARVCPEASHTVMTKAAFWPFGGRRSPAQAAEV